MRKVMLFGVLLAVCVVMSSSASAGVISWMSSENTDDDILSDKSFGFITDTKTTNNPPDNRPFEGDVGWGIARIDSVNGTPTNNTAYIIYSAQLSTPVELSPNTGYYKTEHVETAVSNYSLDDLLGDAATPGLNNQLAGTGSIAAIVEWNGLGVNPFANFATYPFGTPNPDFFLPESMAAAPPSAGLRQDILTLMANSQLLFAVGLEETSDKFVTVGPLPAVTPVTLSLSASLSITYVDSSLNEDDFKSLNSVAAQALVGGASQFLKSSVFNATGGAISTRDTGDYSVNYVPEPTSMMALLGLGLAGSALSLVRRRARKS